MVAMESINLVSLNCDGLVISEAKRNTLTDLTQRHQIVLLQETHFKTHTEAIELLKHKKNTNIHTSNMSENKNRQHGVAILSNSNLNLSKIKTDKQGRVISTLFKLKDQYLNIINIYAPNIINHRKEFLNQLNNYFLSKTNNH
jgi:exonuclease III